ncbi:PREDICTED: uncharacterized protein LOC109584746 [Amphimedon queenslandica]|uniref:MD-2-related lipid-recognition domain-containing protein n=1 Tax=Amphimedon queenslandica TaxID=400682 RepID=A0AAN0JGH5_AMPQE|nr:PREDICTED: uncharacterized protein LOC109584746 [Amphimedon queenslandica]|eukprot:XP_019856140.1 PREDICTED: uncharacterized protein LOC109584746 [Amphimedon queenslandica]
MSFLLIVLLFVLVVSTLTGSANNYYNEPLGNKGLTDCSNTNDYLTITNVSSNIFGQTIKPGHKYYFKGIINLKKEIKWGIMHAKITHQFKNYVNLTFEDANYNLCDISVSVTGKYCPLKPGIYHGIYKDTIPSVLWPGKYIFKIHGYNEDNVELFCAMTEVNVEK